MTLDDDLYLTDAEIVARLGELAEPRTAAERLERRALRELVSRRADQRSGSVHVAHVAHVVRNALVPAQHHLNKLVEQGADPAPRAVQALNRVEHVLAWIDDLVRSHRHHS